MSANMHRIRGIRVAIAAGKTFNSLARQFGVQAATISDIAYGRTWKHVPGYSEVIEVRPGAWTSRGERTGSAKLTETAVSLIRNLYIAGDANQYQLAEQFGVSQTVVWKIIHRHTWKHVT